MTFQSICPAVYFRIVAVPTTCPRRVVHSKDAIVLHATPTSARLLTARVHAVRPISAVVRRRRFHVLGFIAPCASLYTDRSSSSSSSSIARTPNGKRGFSEGEGGVGLGYCPYCSILRNVEIILFYALLDTVLCIALSFITIYQESRPPKSSILFLKIFSINADLSRSQCTQKQMLAVN